MLERNVTIRSVSWNSNESSLLQIYKGAAVAPTVSHDNSAREQSIAQLVTHLQEGVDLEEALQRNGGFISQQPSLSHSSRSRLEQWSQLTATEREQLQHKIAVEARAAQPVDPIQSLRILYIDSHLCVVNKASGVLSVPGPRRNPSIATAVYDLVQPTDIDTMDQMVVHRLDMDTSGILVLALSKTALQTLHRDFRDPLRRRVHKSYQAVLAGHLTGASTVELDVGLERDPHRPPFMRIAQHREKDERHNNNNHTIFAKNKFLHSTPKSSWTELHVQEWGHLRTDDDTLPVTRVTLVPRTGRTHQLRVHCAALGFPVVGDAIYGGLVEGKGDGHRHVQPHDGGSVGSSSSTPRQLQQQQRWFRERPLCLHAHRLSLFHPVSGAPMVFECDPYF